MPLQRTDNVLAVLPVLSTYVAVMSRSTVLYKKIIYYLCTALCCASVVTLLLVRCWYTPVPTPLSVTVGTITYRNSGVIL